MRGAIKKLKKRNAAEGDGTGNVTWIYGGENIVRHMTRIVNRIWIEGGLPEEWKAGIITPIYKGDNSKSESYRGITLMDTGSENICGDYEGEIGKVCRRR